MTYQTIRYSVADAIATIVLARPEKLNAFSVLMKEELMDALDRIDADDAVRAVVLTAEGRAFCAGADISGGTDGFIDGAEAQIRNPDGTFNYASEAARDGGGQFTLRVFRLTKPLIAAINGAAVGIGATMLLPADIRLASEKARFGFVFARRGIVPEAASSWFLPRIAGISKALEWCCTGRMIDAAEALAGGLVSRVLPEDELLPAAYALAREIADNCAPVSVALTRQMMWQGLGQGHPMEAHRIDSRGVLARGYSADAAEGVAAFLEKRQPRFPQAVSRDMPDYYPWWQEPDYS
ncbi:crotonase/enoyl-CoA hydratase family protein [Novosphingobium bradum]|uniref:Crotonase/enoyl-CoA hydratase family protein n=1 Tax=Novosphingobium bradum TaxID=1737444 RepID=A0ABV7ITA9_9SPHN